MVLDEASKVNSVPLSLRAIGLLFLYRDAGRVLPAKEVATLVKEGRDAIRASMKELEAVGLLEYHKFQVNGQWRTEVKLVQKPFGQQDTENGFSGPLSEDPLLTTSANDYSLDLDTYTNKKSKLRLVKKKRKNRQSRKQHSCLGFPFIALG